MLQFKTKRIESEYNELPVHNAKLKTLLDLAVQFVQLEFGKDVVVTEIYRSPEEYKALYAADPTRIPKSPPHTAWQAFDLRSSIYTADEIERLLQFFKCFRFYKGMRSVALYHKIAGNAFHFHVQYGKDA